MEAYSMDLRGRVLAACDAGHGTKEVATRFGVSPSWIRRLKQRRREWGRIEPLPRNSGRKPALDGAARERLRELVRQQPDATLEQLRSHLGVRISISSLWQTLGKLRLTFKKSPCTRRSKTARTSNGGGRRGTNSSKG
jgi:transposase